MNLQQRNQWKAPNSPEFGNVPPSNTLRLSDPVDERRKRLFGVDGDVAAASSDFLGDFNETFVPKPRDISDYVVLPQSSDTLDLPPPPDSLMPRKSFEFRRHRLGLARQGVIIPKRAQRDQLPPDLIDFCWAEGPHGMESGGPPPEDPPHKAHPFSDDPENHGGLDIH